MGHSRNHNRSWLLLTGLVVLSLLPHKWARFDAQEEPERLQERVDIQVVNVDLTALDKKGNYITDLRAEDLMVREDGVPQSILDFSSYGVSYRIALRLGFLFDNSWSMTESKGGLRKLDIAKEALRKMFGYATENDSFVLLLTNPLPSFEEGPIEDRDRIESLMETIRVQGGITLLFDRLSLLIRHVAEKPGRRVIVIFSDGQDSGSRVEFDQILRESHAGDLTVIAVGTTELDNLSDSWWADAKKDAEKGKENLIDLARQTGGIALFPANPSEVPDVFAEMEEFLSSQYSLAYHSSNPGVTGWRSIEIITRRPNVKLIYRSGYYAED